ncbi:EthD domain-containing protein [Myxococcota bacterium]|nr:EthD domain-containing protein [Myxococcota bacterium]
MERHKTVLFPWRAGYLGSLNLPNRTRLGQSARGRTSTVAMVKSIGLLVRRPDLDAAGFRAHYEQNHAPLATRLLGFPGYQRNYPGSDAARAELGFDGFSEFWFQDNAQIAEIGALMQGDIGDVLREDELRFMTPPVNQSYGVHERLYGTRPAPGEAVRAISVVRLPPGMPPPQADRSLDLHATRVRERDLPGVIAALHMVPVREVTPLPEGALGVECVESLWLASREAMAECNAWRSEQGEAPLWEVEESGTPVLAWPY